MFTTNMLITVCVPWLLITASTVFGHAISHPIGKLIKGTFVGYDNQGEEFARLYVCKSSTANYHFTVIKSNTEAPRTANHLIGTGVFRKAGIDYHGNTISNDDCYYQRNGDAQQVTSCVFDTVDLCDHREVTLSFMFKSHSINLHFVKISNKDELLGNDAIAPYQCGIPYDGDVEDLCPLTFLSDIVPESLRAREVQVLCDRQQSGGCFAYGDENGDALNSNRGSLHTQLSAWNNKLVLLKRTESVSVPEDPCLDGGSQISIVVARDTAAAWLAMQGRRDWIWVFDA
eukprot:CAMPEP_0197041656 /NCGR_PEP_ID=MMETSP1384-20130603/18176_1 /TAXON_ID=29189 /ORGANISM="Ammonia sp." /LENGTH=286 /DNA_ID=CAMNT_0042472627 /DNA_START=59 /DNA_END=918 /DNA_ORIENTATION=+